MNAEPRVFPPWLSHWMKEQRILLWGAADLRGFSTPHDPQEKGFRFAISFGIPLDPLVMESVKDGPNDQYAEEYVRLNEIIARVSKDLESEFRARGHSALGLEASRRTDAVSLAGAFPHKTAATRAGLGWIGKNCQLVTRRFGPWVRLGTVFTGMELPSGTAVERSFCGECDRCVHACPAQALRKAQWHPGMPREEILDAHACDLWKKDHYSQYNRGHNCGICSAVCPFGLKTLKLRELQKGKADGAE